MARRITLGLVCIVLALFLSSCVGLDFSPDGSQLVVTWKGELAIVNTDGSGLKSIPDGEKGYMPAWSPNGKYILFLRSGDKYSDLMLYDTVQHKTSKLGERFDPPLAWREDGQRFAAVRQTEKGDPELAWYDMLEGGFSFHVALPFSAVNDLKMIWLPDSDDLALIGQEAGKANVYTLEAGQVKQITKTNDVIGLGLSVDKKQLLWARKSPNLRDSLISLYAYDLVSRNVTRLPFPDHLSGINPGANHAPTDIQYVGFSPDGARLVLLARFPSGTDAKTNQPLENSVCYLMRVDGSEVREIGQTAPMSAGGGAILPVWSRDGKHLATLHGDYKRQALSLYNADGSEPKTLLAAE